MGRLKEKSCLFTGNTGQREEERRGHMGQFPKDAPPLLPGKDVFTAQLFSLGIVVVDGSYSLMCAFIKNGFPKHWVNGRAHLESHEISQRSRSSLSWSHTLTRSLSLLSVWALNGLLNFSPEVVLLLIELFNTAVPNLQDLPGDLKWSWCDSNRNKVHEKYNVLESGWSHPPTPTHIRGKTIFRETSPWCQKGWGLLV